MKKPKRLDSPGLRVVTNCRVGNYTNFGENNWAKNFKQDIPFDYTNLEERVTEFWEMLSNSEQTTRANKQLNIFFEALKDTPKTFQLVWSASKSSTLISAGLTLTEGVIPILKAWAGKLIIDSITGSISLGMLPATGLRQVLPFLAMELDLVMASSITGQLRTYYNKLLQSQLANHINGLILSKAITLDLQFFENPTFYDTLQNARHHANSSALKIVNSSLHIAQHAITLISFYLVLVRASRWLPIIIFVSAIPAFVAQTEFANREFRSISDRAPSSRMTNYIESLLTGERTVKEIKLFELGEMLLNRYMSLREQFTEEDKANASRSTKSGLGWGMLSTLSYYGCYVWTVHRMLTGMITLGDMTMLLAVIRQTQTSVQTLLENLNRVYESNIYLDNLTKYLKLEPALVHPENGQIAPAKIQKGIEFRNVSFCYPGSNQYVIRNINLHIKPGEHMALVGINGAGKTTLIKLLIRLYDPTDGQILLDSVDLRDYDQRSLMQTFSVLFQDFVRYQFTAQENIGFGKLDSLQDMDRIKKAAELGGASPMIENFPKGFDTLLGRYWQGGQELSGGQWQKIALSRAFMRPASVMVLDEPTSALDAQAESEIFQRFDTLLEESIAILISHRFSTVRMADQIIVLSHGEIIEKGTHAELMELRGTYERLFTLQAKGYQ